MLLHSISDKKISEKKNAEDGPPMLNICVLLITFPLGTNKICSSRIELNFKIYRCLFLEFNLKLFWPRRK